MHVMIGQHCDVSNVKYREGVSQVFREGMLFTVKGRAISRTVKYFVKETSSRERVCISFTMVCSLKRTEYRERSDIT
jgi:hypothetical protein